MTTNAPIIQNVPDREGWWWLDDEPVRVWKRSSDQKLGIWKAVGPTGTEFVLVEKLEGWDGPCLKVLEVVKMTTKTPPSEDRWAHRGVGMRCRTCMFFVLKSKGKGLGRCRREAPSLGGWPAVWEDDWCGSHKLDETKI